MARQTRRSVSVKGATYQRIKRHCDAQGLSMSGFLESLIAEKLPEPVGGTENPEPPPARKPELDAFDSAYTEPIKLL